MAQQNIGSLIINLEARTAQIQQDMAQTKRIVGDAMGSIQQDSKRAAEAMEQTADAAGSLQQAGAAVAAGWALDALKDQVIDVARALHQAQIASEKLQKTLFYANGGDIKAIAADIEWLRKLSNELGQEFDSTSVAYAQFAGAVRGSGLEAYGRQIFESMAIAASAFGMSSDEAQGAMLALVQMSAKGVVQAEEFRGQLSERMPVAAQAAAQALGVTTAEFNRMLESGEIVADEFLPKFSDELRKMSQDAAAFGGEAQKASAQFNNAWDGMKKEVAASGLGAFISGQLSIMADAFNDFSASVRAARAEGAGFWGQAAAGGGAVLRFLNPVNAVKYTPQSDAARADYLRKEIAKKQGTLFDWSISETLPQKQASISAMSRELADIERRTAKVGQDINAGQKQAAAAAVAQKAAEGRAADYVGNGKNLTKKERQAKELADEDAAFKAATAGLKKNSKAYLDALSAHESRRAELIESHKTKARTRSGGRAAQYGSTEDREVANLKALIENEKLAAAALAEYGAEAEKLTPGQKLLNKLTQEQAVAKTKEAKAHIEGKIGLAGQLVALEQLNRERLATVQLQKTLTDAAEQATFDSQQWQADAEQELRLLGMAEPYRAAAQAQYQVEAQTKRELFAIQQQINQAIRDESAAKDESTRAEIGRRRGLLEDQYMTVASAGEKKAGQVGAQSLAVQAKTAAEQSAKAARSMSAAWSAAGSSVVQSIGKMMTALGDYAAAQSDLAKEQAGLDEQRSKVSGIKDIEQRGKAETALNALQMDLDKRRADANMQGTAQMMGLASQMFAEGSRGRKAAHQMEMTFLAIEIGQKTASAIVGAVEAVTNQGKGDPYTAIPRALAMAAMMAGVLSQIGASFSTGGGGGAAASVPLNTRGTVLGSTDPSQSVGNSLDWLQQLEADQYAELRGINSGMKDLNRNLSGVAAAIYRNVGLTGQLPSPGLIGTQMGAAESLARKLSGVTAFGLYSPLVDKLLPGLSGLASNIIGGTVGKIFGGGTTKSVVGSGITSTKTTMGAVLSGGMVDVKAWQRIKTEIDGGWFGKDKTKYKNKTSEVKGEVEHLLTQVFRGLGDTLLSVADSLHIDAKKAIRSLTIELPKIDLGGKSGADMQKAVEEAISAMSDTAVDKVLGKVLRPYQQLNEGLLETAVRTVTEMAVVNDALRLSGRKAQSAGLAASQALVGLAGGADKLHDMSAQFFGSFYSEAEQTALKTQRLKEQFSALNMAMPQSREAFRALVSAQNINTDAGRKAYTALLGVAEAFEDVTSSAEKLKAARASFIQDLRVRELNLAGNTKASSLLQFDFAAQQEVEDARKAGRSAADIVRLEKVLAQERLKVITDFNQQALDAQKQLATSLKDWLASQKLGDLSSLSPEAKLAEARKQYDALYAGAAKGDAEAQGKLTAAAEALLAAGKTMYASSAGYTSLESYVTGGIGKLGKALKLPGFARGGLAQGWAIVGEEGPELVNFSNPGRVYTADQTSAALDWSRYGRQDNAALVTEVRALRQEVSQLRSERRMADAEHQQQRGAIAQAGLGETKATRRALERSEAAKL